MNDLNPGLAALLHVLGDFVQGLFNVRILVAHLVFADSSLNNEHFQKMLFPLIRYLSTLLVYFVRPNISRASSGEAISRPVERTIRAAMRITSSLEGKPSSG